MTRTAAFRASAIFVLLGLLFGAAGASSQAAAGAALFLITASVCAVMLLFALATPAHAPVPVRVRRAPPEVARHLRAQQRRRSGGALVSLANSECRMDPRSIRYSPFAVHSRLLPPVQLSVGSPPFGCSTEPVM